MWQQGPHQREAEAVPDGREQQDIDVLLPEFPVGAVQDQIQRTVREKRESKPGEQAVWDGKLYEAE